MLADWYTGQYTVRSLAHKHRVSAPTAYNVVKGKPKAIEPLINKQMEINQELANFDTQSRQVFKQIIDERSKHLELITNATHTNINRMMRKFDKKDPEYVPDMPIMDNKLVQSTLKDARDSLLGREPAIINNQNNVSGGELRSPEDLLKAIKALQDRVMTVGDGK